MANTIKKINFGGAKLCLESNLEPTQFETIISKIKVLASTKGFIVREYQVNGNFSPFGPSGVYPYFQVGKGRQSKRLEWRIGITKKQYPLNRNYSALGDRENTMSGPQGDCKINGEEGLLEALNTLYNQLEEA